MTQREPHGEPRSLREGWLVIAGKDGPVTVIAQILPAGREPVVDADSRAWEVTPGGIYLRMEARPGALPQFPGPTVRLRLADLG